MAVSEPDTQRIARIISSSLVGAKVDDTLEFLNAFIPSYRDVHWVRNAGYLLNPVTVPEGWESATERDDGRSCGSFKSRCRIATN
jgi:hypothetical protein